MLNDLTMPPPAEGFASRLALGPALRAQPDRRLVSLVREGYESAFEEIVRRYAKPLTRYAGAIVGGRAEDVTQDAFSKALQALRRDEAEIDLRPWLYRIVRNTALNDLRDRPEEAEALAESIAGGRTAAEVAEQREQLSALIEALRALPEPQRAAIVMRELEGLSHEEIAAALGLSGGGARQAIYRARRALRDGAALLLPLPLVRFLIDHGGDAASASAAGGATGAALAATGASGAGAGAGGVALKAGVAAAVLAGSVGTGVALRDQGAGHAADASSPPARAASAGPVAAAPATALAAAGVDDSAGTGAGDDRGAHGHGSDDRGADDRVKTGHRDRGGGGERRGRNRGRGGGGRRPPATDAHGPHGGERHRGGGHRGPRPERHDERSGPGGGDGDRSGAGGGGRGGESDRGGPGSSGGEAESRSGPGDGSLPPPPPDGDRSGSGGDGGDSGPDDSGEAGGNSGPGGDGSRDLEP